jgi:hypothetical protein
MPTCNSETIVKITISVGILALLCFAALNPDTEAVQLAEDMPFNPTRTLVTFVTLFYVICWVALYFAGPVIATISFAAAIFQVTMRMRQGKRSMSWWVFPLLLSAPVYFIASHENFWMLALLFWPSFSLGLLVWHLIERRLGNPGLALGPNFLWSWRRRPFLASAMFLLIYKAIVGAKLFMALAGVWISPPDMGSPPYTTRTENARQLYVSLGVKKFPDAQSCLVADADAGRSADLTRIDWDRIATITEAEICIFRLLAASSGIESFATFAQAQGLQVIGRSHGASDFYVEPDGSLRAIANWSIDENGPKFPTRGLYWYFVDIHYFMTVEATWSADGKTLLGVEVDFSSLLN